LDDWKKLINSLLTGNSVDLRIGEKLVTCWKGIVEIEWFRYGIIFIIHFCC
jgi:hypothetical protein